MRIGKRLEALNRLRHAFGAPFAVRCCALRLASFDAYERFVLDALERELAPLIRRYERLPEAAPAEDGSRNIWTLWWQGVDAAPDIVKACLKSQRENLAADGFSYTVITRDNWRRYIELPAHILEKAERGVISLTHLSDIIRAELIRRHGGLWIDATVFCNKPIQPEPVRRLFTIRCMAAPKSLTRGRWTGFMIGDRQGSKLFSFVSEALALYWEAHDDLVAYLLIDFLIAIACRHFPEVSAELARLPVSQTGLWSMLREMNAPYDAAAWDAAVQSADFFKLSYKREYSSGDLRERTADGHLTNWGFLWGRMGEHG